MRDREWHASVDHNFLQCWSLTATAHGRGEGEVVDFADVQMVLLDPAALAFAVIGAAANDSGRTKTDVDRPTNH